MNLRAFAARSSVVLAALAIVTGKIACAAEGDDGPRSDIFDLVLGQPYWVQPQDFQEFACGTNGGPPSLPLRSFAEAAECRPEATGLHEVQFHYDDETYYLALAQRNLYLVDLLQDSKFGDFPIVASGLFDDSGVLRGIRAVTDDRTSDRVRRAAHNMAGVVQLLYGSDGWTCTEIPPAEGEQSIGSLFIKRDCQKVTDDGLLILTEARYLRRQGQSIIDPANGEVRTGLFVSTSRVEIYQTDDGGEPILSSEEALSQPPELPSPSLNSPEAMFLSGYSVNCPGCDLSGADLKGRVLTGANLAGANLAGATLHRTKLDQAILDNANLAGANLNMANLTRASLVGADLSDALLYGANAAAADLSLATLNRVVADEARFTGASLRAVQFNSASVMSANLARSDLSEASLVGSVLYASDLQLSNLTQANLTNAVFFQAGLRAAMLTYANATGADFRQADLTDAVAEGVDFTGARLVGALTRNLNLEGAILQDTLMPDGDIAS